MTNLSTPIEYLKKQAKQLWRQAQANEAEALSRARRALKDPADLSLMRIQHVVAVEHGFLKWEDLLKAPETELRAAIARNKSNGHGTNEAIKRTVTPLGNFFRGPGNVPTPSHLGALADMFDNMTMEEQERYLDKDARTMGLFDRP